MMTGWLSKRCLARGMAAAAFAASLGGAGLAAAPAVDVAAFDGSYNLDAAKCGQAGETAMVVKAPKITFYEASCTMVDPAARADGLVGFDLDCVGADGAYTQQVAAAKTDKGLSLTFGDPLAGGQAAEYLACPKG